MGWEVVIGGGLPVGREGPYRIRSLPVPQLLPPIEWGGLTVAPNNTGPLPGPPVRATGGKSGLAVSSAVSGNAGQKGDPSVRV